MTKRRFLEAPVFTWLLTTPDLESRGFEVAMFYATGMSGIIYANLAAARTFVALMDFALGSPIVRYGYSIAGLPTEPSQLRYSNSANGIDDFLSQNCYANNNSAIRTVGRMSKFLEDR